LHCIDLANYRLVDRLQWRG